MRTASTGGRHTLALVVSDRRKTGAQAQSVSLATNALSERLETMMNDFAVTRESLATGDYKAAERSIKRFLEQNDRAREIAEQIRACTIEPLY